MPPRALDPSGLFLIDKPEGPSSFAVVADVRRRTGARTGHAGTLDPFATGLLLVLSGKATKLAPCFVGLDKRYVTDVDLRAVRDTGDREGVLLEEREPPPEDDDPDRAATAIQGVGAHRCVDVPGSSIAWGTALQIDDCDGSGDQVLTPAPDAAFPVGAQAFRAEVDLRPAKPLVVRVEPAGAHRSRTTTG